MSSPATFESFEKTLRELVERFAAGEAGFLQSSYDEAKLRQDFLDPLFAALGYDLGNRLGLIQSQREVEIESRTMIAGRRKRADYLFRADTRDRFVCEAKKPYEVLDAKHAFQAKRYAWNKNLALAVLSDFEGLKIYVVAGKPTASDDVTWGLYRSWHFREYAQHACELWDLLSRDAAAGGSIDRLLESLPKKPVGKGRARQLWLIRPDRTRALDADFLNFLDEARRTLGSDLLAENDDPALRESTRLNEAVQHILDRLLFLRICEDRDIDIGTNLRLEVENWRSAHPGIAPPRRRPVQRDLLAEEPPTAPWHGGRGLAAPRGSLWHRLVRHCRALDHRPAGLVPFFNGNLFKPHFSEELAVGDVWLAEFLDDIGDDESPYLFNVISVEILGTIYERFLGKVIRPHGRGVTIEEKPEVRKAGGVYYTPRYIVDYIVEQTVGKLLADQPPEKTLALRLLDPACGSGSFLIRVFERVCEHWQTWLLARPSARRRDWCWTDERTGDVHLTAALKRRILTANIYGVDLDPGAVEVTQLSLYLKMLENENRNTLARERDLFPGEDEPALLPPLQDNIKCGNSLIASDFSLVPDDLVRVRAFDWPVQFDAIMRGGGFDAVVGNPPYVRIQTMQGSDPEAVEYLGKAYASSAKGNYDIYVCFVERSLRLLNSVGLSGFILPHKFTNSEYGQPLRTLIADGAHLSELVHFGASQVFEDATTYTCLLFLGKARQKSFRFVRPSDHGAWIASKAAEEARGNIECVTSMAWNFSVGPGAALTDRLKALTPRLGDVADIFVGLQTSADDVFVLEMVAAGRGALRLKSKVLGEEIELEREFLHPLVSGTDIQGYDALGNRQFILFPYAVAAEKASLVSFAEIRRRCPKTAKYLEANRTRLESRENGKFRDAEWYRFGRSQNLGIQERTKLCVPRLVDRLCAAYDAKGATYLDNVDVGGVTLKPNAVKHDLRYLLGLLNSRLIGWFFPSVSAPFRGGWMSANRQFLSLVPFRQIDFDAKPDRARHDRLVALVDKMLALTPKLRAATVDSERATLQNAVAATDRAIDALVYELYALTPEEIALVEGAGTAAPAPEAV